MPIAWMPAGVIAPVARSTRKQVNPATIAGRQVHLGRQHVAERRTEGPDVGEEWPVGDRRLRLDKAVRE